MTEPSDNLSERPFSEAAVLVDAHGEGALERLGPGPFLVEIPTQSPLGFGQRPTSAGTQAETMNFDEQLLLDLRRSRSSDEATLISLEPGVVAGRGSACRLQLALEESVSKEHARFDRDARGWTITDLHTTNGTFVARQRLLGGGTARLEGVVAVQLGSRRFAFVAGPDLLDLLHPVETSEVLRVERLRTELEALGSRRFGLRHPHPYLLVAYKGEGSRSPLDFKPSEAYPLIGEGPLRLGRTSEAELTLRRNSVSKWHARLERAGDHWTVTDTGSSNGTLVNGVQLAAGEPKVLASWDALGFGPSSWGLFMDARALLEWLMEGAD